jgi:PRTRC genetic system protein C
MELQILKREFSFEKDGKITLLPDPESSWTPQKVKEHYTQAHPELINATIGEPKISNDKITYVFSQQTGTKG